MHREFSAFVESQGAARRTFVDEMGDNQDSDFVRMAKQRVERVEEWISNLEEPPL